MSGSPPLTAAFDRGEGNGASRYQLGQRYYEFAVTEKGWELYRKTERSFSAGLEHPACVQASHVETGKGITLFDPIPAISPIDAPL